MKITLNGEETEIVGALTVETLVRARGLEHAACATEVNRRLVRKDERDAATLKDGDRVEIVTLVGGG